MNLKEATILAKQKEDDFTRKNYCPIINGQCHELCVNRSKSEIRTATSSGVLIEEGKEIEYNVSNPGCYNYMFTGEV